MGTSEDFPDYSLVDIAGRFIHSAYSVWQEHRDRKFPSFTFRVSSADDGVWSFYFDSEQVKVDSYGELK